MSNGWTRVSSGQYKNDSTGQVIHSATDPGKGAAGGAPGAAPGAAGPVSAQPVDVSNLTPGLQQAYQNLQSQVQGGSINQIQANAELQRLIGLSGQTSPSVPHNLPLKTPGDLVNAAFDTSRSAVPAGNLLTNPNQQTPFGNQTTTIDPITGQPTVAQTLSQPNQQALSGIQGNAASANNVLGGLISGGIFGSTVNPAGPNGPGPQSNLESAVYQHLTAPLDQQKTKEQSQLESSLAARGLPVGSQAYSQAMQDFNKRYDQQYSDARAQAVQQGIGAGVQGLQALAPIGAAGYQAPNFEPFKSTPYISPDVNAVFQALAQQGISQAQLSNALKIAGIQASTSKANAALGASTAIDVANINNQPQPAPVFNPNAAPGGTTQ